MQCPGFPDDTYAFHALDQLQGSERDEIDEHLRYGCETCVAGMERSRSLWYAVGSATRLVDPPKSLRRKVLNIAPQPIRWWRQPWPVLEAAAAVVLVFSAGMFAGRAIFPGLNQIAFTPVYPAPARDVSEPVAVPPPPQSIVKQVADPEQTRLIETLNQDLYRERLKTQQLEGELGKQRNLVAAARDSGAEAEKRFRAAPPNNGGDTAALRGQLAVLTARASDLERQVEQYKVLVDAQRKRLDQTVQIANMVTDPSLRVVRMRATEKAQAVEGHAAIAGGSRMVFYASHLPALPGNRTYQLWLVRSNGSAVASAGIFNPDASSNAVLQVQDPALLSGVTALAVTDEPSGGSKSPTGHKWMIGS